MGSGQPIRSARGYTLIELVVVMAVIGTTLYVVLPRLTAAVVADPLKDAVGYLSNISVELRAKAVASQTRQDLHVDIDNNRLFTADQGTVPDEPARPTKVFGLGEDLRLVGVRFPQKSRVSGGTALICFHRQGHADQALIHVVRADGRRFTLYSDPFFPGIKIYPDHIDYDDLLAAEQ